MNFISNASSIALYLELNSLTICHQITYYDQSIA